MKVTDEYDQTIRDAVDAYFPTQYDWRLYKAQLIQESRLDPLAKSSAGAVGISQMMPGTWRQWAAKTFTPDGTASYAGQRRTNPIASIDVGAAYMKYLIEQWSWERPTADRYCLAMASYNAGLGSLLRAQKTAGNPSLYAEIIPFLYLVTGKKNANETIVYVSRILDYCSDQIIGQI